MKKKQLRRSMSNRKKRYIVKTTNKLFFPFVLRNEKFS